LYPSLPKTLKRVQPAVGNVAASSNDASAGFNASAFSDAADSA
jgi:hypothetical protein